MWGGKPGTFSFVSGTCPCQPVATGPLSAYRGTGQVRTRNDLEHLHYPTLTPLLRTPSPVAGGSVRRGRRELRTPLTYNSPGSP